MTVTNKQIHINISAVLSEREVQVLQLAASGQSNKQIADILSLSVDTIDTHNRNIVAKLEAKNMKHAIALGMRMRIID